MSLTGPTLFEYSYNPYNGNPKKVITKDTFRA